MRILWLTIDRSNRIAHHFDDFRQTVSELPEVEVVTLKKPSESGGVSIWRQSRELLSGQLKLDNLLIDYLSRDNNFNFIFCDAFFAYTDEDWKFGSCYIDGYKCEDHPDWGGCEVSEEIKYPAINITGYMSGGVEVFDWYVSDDDIRTNNKINFYAFKINQPSRMWHMMEKMTWYKNWSIDYSNKAKPDFVALS